MNGRAIAELVFTLGMYSVSQRAARSIRRERSRLSFVQTTTLARIGQHEYAQETAASVR